MLSNYPPGTFEADPSAPWNEPDIWVGMTCLECRFAYWWRKKIYVHENGKEKAKEVIHWFCLADAILDGYCELSEIEPNNEACERFEQ